MQSKFDVGMSTNYEVVQAQRDYLDAQNNALRALLNYRKALVNFETVQTVGHALPWGAVRRAASAAPAAADSNIRNRVTDMKKLIWIVLILIAAGAGGAVILRQPA